MFKNITVYVLIAIVLFLAASFIPYFLTASAPAHDGQQIMGWPLSFYSYGGLCKLPATADVAICRSFHPNVLLVDFVLAAIAAYPIWFLIRRKFLT